VNPNVGSCGDATHVAQVTLNGKGLATGCTAVAITTGGAGTVTTVGDLSPFFTVTSRTSTPTFVLTAASAHSFFGNNTGSSATPAYFQPAFTDLSGSLACTQFPNLSGDVHNTSSTCATNVVGVNGILFSSFTSGLLKIANGTGAISTATPGTDYLTPTGSAAGLSVTSSSAFGVTKVDGTTIKAASGVISVAAPTFTTLTDSSSVTWAIGSAIVSNSTLTVAHTTSTRAINLTGLVNGGSYVLVFKQDSTGGAAATLGTGCTWFQGGSAGFTALTTLALTTTASATNILAFVYDGTACYANLR
jgi:hypothetical protein